MEKKTVWIIVIVGLIIVGMCCCAVLLTSLGAYSIIKSQPTSEIWGEPDVQDWTEPTRPGERTTEEPLPLPTIDLPSTPSDNSESTPSSQDESNIPAEMLNQMKRIEKDVSKLRGLPPATDMIRKLFTPEQLEQRVMDDFFADYTEKDVKQDAIVFNLFGLLDRDFDLYDLFVNLYSEQIAGFYDNDTKEMVVIQGKKFAGPERMTYAHEYTHAMQDAKYDLKNGLNWDEDACKLDSEYCAAISALVEGDASLTEMQWFLDYSTLKDKQEILQFYNEMESPVYDSTPEFLKEDFLFPYNQGLDFVTSLHDQGGFAAVDQAYLNPPVSTEQIMHPERYPQDKPVKIELDDFTHVLGNGWEEIERNALGEWYTYLLLAKPLSTSWALPEREASAAAEGWGGDLYLVYHNSDQDQDALISLSQWDTQTDADEYWKAFINYGKKRWGAATTSSGERVEWKLQNQSIVIIHKVDQVLWVITPDQALMTAVLAGFPAFK